MKRTVWPFLPSPRSCSSAMPWVSDGVDALAGLDQAGRLDVVTVRTALARLSSDSQRFRRLSAPRGAW